MLDLTICVLLYGDYPRLARRVLSRAMVSQPPDKVQLRVGMNACSATTRAFIRDTPELRRAVVYDCGTNKHKYPLMRDMLYDAAHPLASPYVAWFDDDSFIRSQTTASAWRDDLLRAMETADMVGQLYRLGLVGNQADWIEDQPWYGGKSVREPNDPRWPHYAAQFATGAFWCIRAEILRHYNWPPFELDHRGGDVMLGELCRQQNLRLQSFTAGVAINADHAGKSGASCRRGYDSRPIGYDYQRVRS